MTAIVLPMAALAVAVAYVPPLAALAADLWATPHYQHFPFVVLASCVLMAVRFGDEAPARRGGVIAIFAVAVVAWLLLAGSYLVPSPFFGGISAILMVGVVGVSVARSLGRRFPLGSWALLWLVIPIPLGYDRRLIEALQRFSSHLASQALDLMRIDHLMDGNTLVFPDREFFVAETCSGIVSVISIASCGAMYGVWRRRGLVHTLLLMAAGVGWAMLLNVVRIVVIAVAHVRNGADLASDPAHTVLGLVIFGLGLVALVATDWLLQAALAEIEGRWKISTAEPIHFGRWPVAIWDRLVGIGVTDQLDEPEERRLGWSEIGRFARGGHWAPRLATLVAFGLLSAWGVTQADVFERRVAVQVTYDSEQMIERLPSIDEVSAPSGFKIVDRSIRKRPDGDAFGEYSVIFTVEDESGRLYLVSCDFPYSDGWHPLAVCYRGIGWRIDDRRVEPEGVASSGEAYETVTLEMTKPDGAEALLRYCVWWETGEPSVAPRDGFYNRVVSAFTRSERGRVGHTLQAQVLVQRPDGVSDRDRRVAAELLRHFRPIFVAATLAND